MIRRSRDAELRRVYGEHLDAVFAYFSFSVRREVAEDLTASTFERVIRHWDRFDPSRASERTWILTIARNALTDHWRRQSYRNAASLDEHPFLAAQVPSPDDGLASRMAEFAFADWLQLLPSRDRQVIALRYGADLSAADTATALGLTEGNVHQIASRALKKLRTSRAVDQN